MANGVAVGMFNLIFDAEERKEMSADMLDSDNGGLRH